MTQKRQPITLTDEGDGRFIVTMGDKYSTPDVRWNIIGIVLEWLYDGDGDLPWLETAEEHRAFSVLLAEIEREEKEGDGT